MNTTNIMELKAQDLRVGNYVINPFGSIGIVDEIHKSGFKIKSTLYALEHCKPIPITEDILLKCGFEWSIQHQAYYLKDCDYVVDICQDYCRVIKYRRTGEVITRLIYLHELQNLILALTKTELEITL